MKALIRAVVLVAACAGMAGPAWADRYSSTITLFRHAGASGSYFEKSYGYAVFPTIGKGGLAVGGAYGRGRVYQHGRAVGATSMTQVSVGFQAGGEGYSEIIFFEDKASFDKFAAGDFALGANVGAVAITAGASASAGTSGTTAAISGDKNDAKTAGGYFEGLAVFTIAKGGLMYEATVAGQKFSYRPLKGH
jgi:lipid-binding SYLF domain-containing protein